MTKKEILQYSEKVIDRQTMDEIRRSDDVKVIRDNGMAGKHLGKRWYVVVFKGGDGISVYCTKTKISKEE